MALGSGLVALFGTGPRECLFDAKRSTVDLSAVCHDVRGLEVADDERLFVTVKDMRKHGGEQLVPVGTACHLKSVELDASLLLRVWAAQDEASARQKSEGARGRRNCGEVRVPLHQLLIQCDGMLYQTWVTLDCPGLNDSVASVGLGDEASTLEQKIVDGQRQLFQPRAFLSMGKTANLAPSGEFLLPSDATPEARVAHWTPLLRSQQQHAVMSAALHLQGGAEAPNVERRLKAQARLQDLRARVQAQGDSTDALRQQLQEADDKLAVARAANREPPATPPSKLLSEDKACSEDAACRREPLRAVSLETEVERLRAANDAEQARVEAARAELESVRREANGRVDAANERIRGLRRERDESVGESRRLEAEVEQAVLQKQEMSNQKGQLLEKIEALKHLVEELFEAVNGAGLQASRKSFESIHSIFKLT